MAKVGLRLISVHPLIHFVVIFISRSQGDQSRPSLRCYLAAFLCLSEYKQREASRCSDHFKWLLSKPRCSSLIWKSLWIAAQLWRKPCFCFSYPHLSLNPKSVTAGEAQKGDSWGYFSSVFNNHSHLKVCIITAGVSHQWLNVKIINKIQGLLDHLTLGRSFPVTSCNALLCGRELKSI